MRVGRAEMIILSPSTVTSTRPSSNLLLGSTMDHQLQLPNQTEKSCNRITQSEPVFCLSERASAVARQMFGLDRCVVERHPSIWPKFRRLQE